MGLSLLGKFLLYPAGAFFVLGLFSGNIILAIGLGFIGMCLGYIVGNFVAMGGLLFEKK